MNMATYILMVFSFYATYIQTSTIQPGNLEWMTQNLSVEVPGAVCLEDCEQDGYFYSIQEARAAATKIGNGWRVPTNEDWLILEENLTKNTPGKAYTKGALKIFEKTTFINSFSGLLSSKQKVIEDKKAVYFLTDTKEENPVYNLTRKFTKDDDLIYKSVMSNEYKLKVRLVRNIE